MIPIALAETPLVENSVIGKESPLEESPSKEHSALDSPEQTWGNQDMIQMFEGLMAKVTPQMGVVTRSWLGGKGQSAFMVSLGEF
jgi:hypothetical protein